MVVLAFFFKGAKLANIFSTEFVVETAHKPSGQQYRQVFTDNMTKGHGKAKVKKNDKGENWTKITFKPDLAKFGMTELDDDIIALMTRRVYDMAGVSKGVKVSFNGKRIPINTFKDYCDMVLANSGHDFPVVHEIVNDRWEVCMTVSTEGYVPRDSSALPLPPHQISVKGQKIKGSAE